jgi:hypothetical protein
MPFSLASWVSASRGPGVSGWGLGRSLPGVSRRGLSRRGQPSRASGNGSLSVACRRLRGGEPAGALGRPGLSLGTANLLAGWVSRRGDLEPSSLDRWSALLRTSRPRAAAASAVAAVQAQPRHAFNERVRRVGSAGAGLRPLMLRCVLRGPAGPIASNQVASCRIKLGVFPDAVARIAKYWSRGPCVRIIHTCA